MALLLKAAILLAGSEGHRANVKSSTRIYSAGFIGMILFSWRGQSRFHFLGCPSLMRLCEVFLTQVVLKEGKTLQNFFGVRRQCQKTLESPGGGLRSKPISSSSSACGAFSSRRIATQTLNNGLRPHLTRWQARFRHWYDKCPDDMKRKCPQDCQRGFPEYEQLIDDMKTVNRHSFNTPLS